MDNADESVVSLIPEAYFGVSPEVEGNGCFLNHHTYGYVSGRTFITEDLRSREQSYWHIPKYAQKHLINAIIFDDKREIIVVSEEGRPPTLHAYRLSDMTRILYLSPKESTCEKFTSMFVHCDSDRVSALLGSPDNLIYTCRLDDASLEAVTVANHKNINTHVSQIVGHFEDTFHYAILGIGIFRFMMWMGDIWEDVFRSFNNAIGIAFTCGIYASYDTILAGTADGYIYNIAHDGIKAIYNALYVERIYIEVKKKGTKPQKTINPPTRDVCSDGFERKDEVKFIQRFSKGFVYLVKSEKKERLHMFLKGRLDEKKWISDLSFKLPPEGDPYQRHGYIKIRVGQVSEYEELASKNRCLLNITNMSMTEDGKLIGLTFQGRFFMIIAALSHPSPPKTHQAQYMSIGCCKVAIDHIVTCPWKPIFVTLGDRALKMYDYKERKAYHLITFQDFAYSLSLHPTGNMALIGFSDCVVMFQLEYQQLSPLMKVGVECCKASLFSDWGCFAVICDETRMRIYETVHFTQKLDIQDCQAGKINSLYLCPKFNHIWASTTSGSITKTSLKDGNKKYLYQTTHVKSFAPLDNFRFLYVSTFDGRLQEINTAQDEISHEIYLRHGQLCNVVVAQHLRLIIVGTETGYVLVLKAPLTAGAEPIVKKKMHYAPVMKVALSEDETYVLSSGKDGSVCLWRVDHRRDTDTWSGCYATSKHFPYGLYNEELTDSSDISQMIDLEKDYFSRQLKIMTFPKAKHWPDDARPIAETILNREIEEHVKTKGRFQMFQCEEFRGEMEKLIRDKIIEDDKEHEKFLLMEQERTKDFVTLLNLTQDRAKEFNEDFFNRLIQMYDQKRGLDRYLQGGLFQNYKENVTDYIRNHHWFMKHFQNRCNKKVRDIMIKIRNLVAMKSSPKYVKKIRKKRRHNARIKEVLRATLHREILLLLKFHKAREEFYRLKGEYVKHPFESDGDAESGGEASDKGDDGSISLVHSDDPINTSNVKGKLAREITPPPSLRSGSEDDPSAERVCWPRIGKEKPFIALLTSMLAARRRRKAKRKPGSTYVRFKVSNGKHKIYPISRQKPPEQTKIEQEENCNALREIGAYGEDDRAENVSDINTITGKSITIKKEKGFFRKKGQNKPSRRLLTKRRFFGNAFSKLKASTMRQRKVEEFISKWNPEEKESNMIALKKPLTRRNHGFILKMDSRGSMLDGEVGGELNPSRQLEDERRKSEDGRKETIFQLMYSIYIHPETIVKQISPLRYFKKNFPKSKFKSLLIKYSPGSKLNKLATKHLVRTHLVRLEERERGADSWKQAKKRTMLKDIIDYDLFSQTDRSLSDTHPSKHSLSKDSFFSVSSMKCHNQPFYPDSLSSLQEFSAYSKSTLPGILRNHPSETRQDESFYSKVEKCIPGPKPDLGKESNINIGNTDKDNTGNSSRTSLEQDMSSVLKTIPAPTSSKANKKRWEKLMESSNIWDTDNATLEREGNKKILKMLHCGEREIPPMRNTELKQEKLGEVSEEVSTYMKDLSKKDIAALKKLNVINQMSELKDDINERQEEPGAKEGNIIDAKRIQRGNDSDGTVNASDIHTSSSLCSYDPLDLSQLLLHETQNNPFVRMGKLEQLEADKVKYDFPPKNTWEAFDPPISKELMNTMLKYDLLGTIKKVSSDESLSEQSAIFSFSQSDSSPFDYEKLHLKDSDTSLWKKYMLEEEKEMKTLKNIGFELTKDDLMKDQSESVILEDELIEGGLSDIEEEQLSQQLSAVLEDPCLDEEFSHNSTEEDLQSAIATEEKLLELDEEEESTENEENKLRKEPLRKKFVGKNETQELTKEKGKEDEGAQFASEGSEAHEEGAIVEEIEEEEHFEYELEEQKLNKYIKFLKKYKGFYVNAELFPCVKDIPLDAVDEVEEALTEEESVTEAEVRDDSRMDEEEGIDEEQTATDGGQAATHSGRTATDGQTATDGRQMKKKRKTPAFSTNVSGVKAQPSIYIHVSKSSSHETQKNLNPKEKTKKESEDDLLQQVWEWWNELIVENKREEGHKGKESFSSLVEDVSRLEKDGGRGPLMRLEKDGRVEPSMNRARKKSCQGSNEEEYERTVLDDDGDVSDELAQQLLMFSQPKPTPSDQLIDFYNMRLWQKLFHIDHPRTADSYQQLSENLKKRKLKLEAKAGPKKTDVRIFKKRQIPKGMPFLTYKQKPPGQKESFKELQLKTNSEISFEKVFKRSLPMAKDPDAPSDEIDSLSSPSFIVHVDEEENKYSFYMKQTVRIKTNLKNKIWFVPEGGKLGEFTKGKFYYPGDIWTKGRTSTTLRYYKKLPINDKKDNLNQQNKYKSTKNIMSGDKFSDRRKNLRSYKKLNKSPLIKNVKLMNSLRSKDVKLHIKKSKGLHLLKENLEKVKFVKVNMAFGAFYILPFRLKKFWKMLSKAIGNRLTIKLRTEVLKGSRAIKTGTDNYRSKEKDLTAANITSQGDVLLKLTSFEKLEINEKKIMKLLNKNKDAEMAQKKSCYISDLRSSSTTKNVDDKKDSYPGRKTDFMRKSRKYTTDTLQKFNEELVAEFFPEHRIRHGTFYKKMKLKKWLCLFKEDLLKSRGKKYQRNATIYKIQKPRPKISDPFKKKFLRDIEIKKDPISKKRVFDKEIKEWLERHVGIYKGPREELEGVTKPCKELSLRSNQRQNGAKEIDSPDELKNKVNEWLAVHYKYLRAKVKIGKPFKIYGQILEFDRKRNSKVKRTVPNIFIQRVRHFKTALQRWLKSLNKKITDEKKNQNRKISIKPKEKKLTLKKGSNIIKHFTKESIKCNEKLKISRKKENTPKNRKYQFESLEKLFGEERWKKAIQGIKEKKEVPEHQKSNIDGDNKEEKLINIEEKDWNEPGNGVIRHMEADRILPLKPYLKWHWPHTMSKVKKKTLLKIQPAIDRKYEEPAIKCISIKDELKESNKERVEYGRRLKAINAVSGCGQALHCLPKGTRARMSALSRRFNLPTFDTNYYNLAKIKNHFIGKNLYDLRKYCLNAENVRNCMRQEHDIKQMYYRRKEIFEEELEKADIFSREYDMHKILSSSLKHKTEKARPKVIKRMKSARDKYDRLKNIRSDIRNVLGMFHDQKGKENFKEVVKKLIAKYLPNTKKARKEEKIATYYEDQIIKNINDELKPFEDLNKKYKSPKKKRIGAANRFVKFAHEQEVAEVVPKEYAANKLGYIGPFDETDFNHLKLKTAEFLNGCREGKIDAKEAIPMERELTRQLMEKLIMQTAAINLMEEKLKSYSRD